MAVLQMSIFGDLAALHHPLRDSCLPTLRRIPWTLGQIIFLGRSASRGKQNTERNGDQKQALGNDSHRQKSNTPPGRLQARHPASIQA